MSVAFISSLPAAIMMALAKQQVLDVTNFKLPQDPNLPIRAFYWHSFDGVTYKQYNVHGVKQAGDLRVTTRDEPHSGTRYVAGRWDFIQWGNKLGYAGRALLDREEVWLGEETGLVVKLEVGIKQVAP